MQSLFRRGEDDKALEVFARGVLGNAFFDRLSSARIEQSRENVSGLRAFALGGEQLPLLPEAEVRGVRVPSLLLTGKHSAAFLHRLTDRLEELLPNVERLEIPEASHLMHEDNAPAVNEAIVDFVGRHRSQWAPESSRDSRGLNPEPSSQPGSRAARRAEGRSSGRER